jgi:hypothetical protein
MKGAEESNVMTVVNEVRAHEILIHSSKRGSQITTIGLQQPRHCQVGHFNVDNVQSNHFQCKHGTSNAETRFLVIRKI